MWGENRRERAGAHPKQEVRLATRLRRAKCCVPHARLLCRAHQQPVNKRRRVSERAVRAASVRLVNIPVALIVRIHHFL
eukprot:scaffold168730_cov26-Tisochrysis_lutea.AAC.1